MSELSARLPGRSRLALYLLLSGLGLSLVRKLAERQGLMRSIDPTRLQFRMLPARLAKWHSHSPGCGETAAAANYRMRVQGV